MDDSNSSSYIKNGELFARKLYQPDNDIRIIDAYYSSQNEDKYVTLNRAYIQSVFVLLVKRYEIDFKEKENITNFKNFITYLFICYVYHFYIKNMQIPINSEYCKLLNDNILNILNETFDINGVLNSYFKIDYTDGIKLNHLFDKEVINARRREQQAIKRQDEARRGEEEARRREEEAREKLEIARRVAEEARRVAEEEARKQQEEETRRVAEKEARKREEEARKEEEVRKREEERARKEVGSQLNCVNKNNLKLNIGNNIFISYNIIDNFLFLIFGDECIKFYHICNIFILNEKKSYVNNNMFISEKKNIFLYVITELNIIFYNINLTYENTPFIHPTTNEGYNIHNIMNLNNIQISDEKILEIMKYHNNLNEKCYKPPPLEIDNDTSKYMYLKYPSSRNSGGNSKNDLNKIYGIYILFLNKLLLRNKIPEYKKNPNLTANA